LVHVPLLMLLVLSGFVRYWTSTAASMRSVRASISAYVQRNPNDGTVKYWIKQYGSLQKAIDEQFPEPYSVAGLRRAWNSFRTVRANGGGADYAPTAVLIFLWPWLTYLMLMVFRVSMARAKVKPIHVLRCVIYSCDAFLIAIVLLAPIVPEFSQFSYDPIRACQGIVVACLILASLTLYKLGFAYHLYLRFPHAWATAVVSQVVVALAIVSMASAMLFW